MGSSCYHPQNSCRMVFYYPSRAFNPGTHNIFAGGLQDLEQVFHLQKTCNRYQFNKISTKGNSSSLSPTKGFLSKDTKIKAEAERPFLSEWDFFILDPEKYFFYRRSSTMEKVKNSWNRPRHDLPYSEKIFSSEKIIKNPPLYRLPIKFCFSIKNVKYLRIY